MPNVQIAGQELAERGLKTKTATLQREMSASEAVEATDVETIIEARRNYEQDRKTHERQWTESYKMYNSWVDSTKNPFMANLFIPKVHEAVRLLSAFLVGTNQSITAEPEPNGHIMKAKAASRWLDFLWRKIIKARMKIVVWIKQGIVFGNGILKVGWDVEKKRPFMSTTAIEDVFFSFWDGDIQDSPFIIHEIRRSPDEVMSDDKYDRVTEDGTPIRDLVITGGTESENNDGVQFSRFDSALTNPACRNKVPLLEAWSHPSLGNYLYTLAPTQNGWRILRKVENPHKWKDGESFRPFVKLRFDVSPVPNRAYDTGAIYPTVKIQKAFNDLMNEYFDNVALINNKMWIKRRGARINPRSLVRRPGGIITVSNIANDLKSEEVSDVKGSIVEMLNRLDAEFQQASMVVNLLKGVPGAEFATEAALGQENVQTLLDMIDQNISDALSEVGQMVLAITFANIAGNQTIQLFENEREVGFLEFNPKELNSRYEIRVEPDRSGSISKVIMQKQIIDFLSILSRDQVTLAKYPSLPEKVYRRWLEYGGHGDIDSFFEEAQSSSLSIPSPVQPNGQGGGVTLPGRDKNNTAESIAASANAPRDVTNALA